MNMRKGVDDPKPDKWEMHSPRREDPKPTMPPKPIDDPLRQDQPRKMDDRAVRAVSAFVLGAAMLVFVPSFGFAQGGAGGGAGGGAAGGGSAAVGGGSMSGSIPSGSGRAAASACSTARRSPCPTRRPTGRSIP